MHPACLSVHIYFLTQQSNDLNAHPTVVSKVLELHYSAYKLETLKLNPLNPPKANKIGSYDRSFSESFHPFHGLIILGECGDGFFL